MLSGQTASHTWRLVVIMTKFEQLDIVVANAGVELVGRSVLDFTEADFDRLFAVNAKGAFFTLQRAARHIADQGLREDKGPKEVVREIAGGLTKMEAGSRSSRLDKK